MAHLTFLPVAQPAAKRVQKSHPLTADFGMHSRLYISARLLWIIANFLEQSSHRVRPDVSMDELGADSLDMVELQALIEEAFDVYIDHQIRTYVTFAELVELVYRATQPTTHPAPRH
ncbi:MULTISPECIES: acyl carrier protein [Pseudomonas]|uniref:acyl carrier protein n=1 Tax=Pseudomonas TaxID=286 RepID=UPI001E643A43|nr:MULTISPECIES: acyl carrier protein [Pseudomonas]MCE1117249.1 acyl carrier protein [Pseudomonas sp. NMI795_08]